MAHLDWGAVAKGKERKDSYEALKAEVSEFNEKEREAAMKKSAKKGFHPIPKRKVHKYEGAVEHFLMLEAQMREQKEQIEKYQKFFEMLKELTPRHFSVHDVLG